MSLRHPPGAMRSARVSLKASTETAAGYREGAGLGLPLLSGALQDVLGNAHLARLSVEGPADAQDLYLQSLFSVAEETGFDVRGFLPWQVDATWMSWVAPVVDALFLAEQVGDVSGASSPGAVVSAALRGARGQDSGAGLETLLRRTGGGRALTGAEQVFLTQVHGRSFPEARVHEGPAARAAAEAIAARAFTVGFDIYAGAEGVGLHSADAAELLAHEVTHVRQAGEGSLPTPTRGGLTVSSPSQPHEREAEALGRVGRSLAAAIDQGGLDITWPTDAAGQAIAGHLQARFEAAGFGDAAVGREVEAPAASPVAEAIVSRDEESEGQKEAVTPQAKGAVPKAKSAGAGDVFTEAEAKAISEKWKTQGAYKVSDANTQEPTKEWILWRREAKRFVKKNLAKLTQAENDEIQKWLQRFEAYEIWQLRQTGVAPEVPGAAPHKLSEAVGRAPPSPAFEKVTKHEITMPDGSTKVTYKDHPVANDYEYLRDNTGVGRGGQKLKNRKDIEEQFAKAGITDESQKRVLRAVSEVEGGFEAVNTYDTGFVSVGIIQFITGENGKGSLAEMLRKTKAADASQFATYFHNLGIDVDKNGVVVVDPETGAVLHGSDAVSAIIRDKRLTAIFEQAGLNSSACQTAQMKTSVEKYYAANFAFQDIKVALFTGGGESKYFYGSKALSKAQAKAKKVGGDATATELPAISGKYGDLYQSEAGRAALMDKWVQYGSGTKKFNKGIVPLLEKHQITTVEELAKIERELIPLVQNRIEVLERSDLSQPP